MPLAARDPYPAGFRAILADPPYSEEDATHYPPGGAAYPTPNTILRRALEAVPVGCRVGILHYAWAAPPPSIAAKETAAIAVGTGRNGRLRRRKCLMCGKRVFTVEIPMDTVHEIERVAVLLAGFGAMAAEAQTSVQTLTKWRVPKGEGLIPELSDENACGGASHD